MAKSPARLLIETFAEPLYRLYSSDLRTWKYEELDLLVMPGVFHPGWFVTSRMLLDKIDRLELQGKSVLELGCGSGAQACRAAQLGAISHASDVTPVACKNAQLNAERNGLQVSVFASDIFESIPEGVHFDYVFVNPPFLPSYPEEERDFAFCCGEQYEYYMCLFQQLRQVLHKDGRVIMALAKSCEIERILALADMEKIQHMRIDKLRRWAETNYLFEFSIRD